MKTGIFRASQTLNLKRSRTPRVSALSLFLGPSSLLSDFQTHSRGFRLLSLAENRALLDVRRPSVTLVSSLSAGRRQIAQAGGRGEEALLSLRLRGQAGDGELEPVAGLAPCPAPGARALTVLLLGSSPLCQQDSRQSGPGPGAERDRSPGSARAKSDLIFSTACPALSGKGALGRKGIY